MSRHTRKTIARGVALVPEHVFDLPQTIKGDILAGDVRKGEIVKNRAPFYVNVWWPWIHSVFAENRYLSSSWGNEIGLSQAFVIPPLQDDFSATGSFVVDTPPVELDAVSFGFDQRAEAAAITCFRYGDTGGAGLALDQPLVAKGAHMHAGWVDKYNFRLTIHAKEQRFFDGTVGTRSTGHHPENAVDQLVWSGDLSFTALANDTVRANPMLWADIGITLDPYKTYVLSLWCPDICNNDTVPPERVMIVNPLCRIRCLQHLVPSDFGSSIQNIPSVDNGVKTAYQPASMLTPAAGDEIKADGGAGVVTMLGVLDERFRSGFRGGYHRLGGRPPSGVDIYDDAAYEVISIPLWGNQKQGQFDDGTASVVPYTTGAGTWGPGPVADRRYVKLRWPMTVHHVVAAFNWQRNNHAEPGYPTDGEVKFKIGLLQTNCIRGDDAAFDNIAYVDVTFDRSSASGWRAKLIDTINQPGAFDTWEPAMDLLAVPLVDKGADYGTGYYQQGKPFFTGPTHGAHIPRQNIGNTAGASIAPACAGTEEWMVARWSIECLGGKEFGTLTGIPILAGYGGCTLYVIGKKHLL